MKNIYKLIIATAIMLMMNSCQNFDLNQLLQGGEINIGAGLKEALAKGTKDAVSSLSKEGGYSENPMYKLTVIPGARVRAFRRRPHVHSGRTGSAPSRRTARRRPRWPL